MFRESYFFFFRLFISVWGNLPPITSAGYEIRSLMLSISSANTYAHDDDRLRGIPSETQIRTWTYAQQYVQPGFLVPPADYQHGRHYERNLRNFRILQQETRVDAYTHAYTHWLKQRIVYVWCLCSSCVFISSFVVFGSWRQSLLFFALVSYH